MKPGDNAQHIDVTDAGRPRSVVADERLRYQMWILRQMSSRDDLYKQRFAVRRLKYTPLISIITPVYNTPPYALRRMLRSVKDQTYPHWELCLVDDGSPEEWVTRMLTRAAASDARIRFRRRPHNGGIVAASNDALDLATGEFAALLDHDDELEPQALYRVAGALNEQPDLDMIYTDFDMIGTDGIRTTPACWPAWSPELLRSIPYAVHLSVYRRTFIQSVGAFRKGFDGSQDYDLMLRTAEATARIGHIPEILYHWRACAGSTADDPDAKPYAFEAGKRALDDHLTRTGIGAVRGPGPTQGSHRLHFDQTNLPSVSVVVSALPSMGSEPARSVPCLVTSLTNIVMRTDYPQVEYVVVVPAETPADERSALVGVAPDRLRVVESPGAADAAVAANVGAAHATGELLLFLGEDLEILTDDWLTDMQGYAQFADVGAVGAKVYADTGAIEHAGIVLPRGRPHHAHHGMQESSIGYVWGLSLARNYAAVSGACMMTPRTVFKEVSGFRPAASVGYSDVDYCLRVRERGYRIVFTPHARLRYRRPPPVQTPEAAQERLATFQRQWPDLPAVDPYYNVQFCQDDGNAVLDPFAR